MHCCSLECECQEKGKVSLLLHTICGRFDGAARKSGTLAMYPEVWGELPDELFEQTLLSLPVVSQYRLRTIDKKWHRVLTSGRFLRLTLSRAARMHKSRQQQQQQQRLEDLEEEAPLPICAYSYIHADSSSRDVTAMKQLVQDVESTFIDVHRPRDKESARFVRDTASLWHMKRPAQVARCDMAFFPAKLLPYSAQNHARMRLGEDGLLVTLLGEDRGLYLINPLTRTWRELPVYRHPAGTVFCDTPFAMVLDGADCSCTEYRVVALKSAYISGHHAQDRPWSVAVFSSQSGAWRASELHHHRALNVLQGWMRTVGNDGRIYSHNDTGLLLVHDLEGRLVVEATPGFPRPRPPVAADSDEDDDRMVLEERLGLMEHKGCLFVAVKFKEVGSGHRALGISKLDRSTLLWGPTEFLVPSRPVPVQGHNSLTSPNHWRMSHNWTGRVGLVGDFIWVAVVYQHHRTLENLQRVEALHIPTWTWSTLDTEFEYPFTKDFRLFQPKALHIHL